MDRDVRYDVSGACRVQTVLYRSVYMRQEGSRGYIVYYSMGPASVRQTFWYVLVLISV